MFIKNCADTAFPEKTFKCKTREPVVIWFDETEDETLKAKRETLNFFRDLVKTHNCEYYRLIKKLYKILSKRIKES